MYNHSPVLVLTSNGMWWGRDRVLLLWYQTSSRPSGCMVVGKCGTKACGQYLWPVPVCCTSLASKYLSLLMTDRMTGWHDLHLPPGKLGLFLKVKATMGGFDLRNWATRYYVGQPDLIWFVQADACACMISWSGQPTGPEPHQTGASGCPHASRSRDRGARFTQIKFSQ